MRLQLIRDVTRLVAPLVVAGAVLALANTAIGEVSSSADAGVSSGNATNDAGVAAGDDASPKKTPPTDGGTTDAGAVACDAVVPLHVAGVSAKLLLKTKAKAKSSDDDSDEESSDEDSAPKKKKPKKKAKNDDDENAAGASDEEKASEESDESSHEESASDEEKSDDEDEDAPKKKKKEKPSSLHYGAGLEVAGYDDTDHVAVVTPALTAHAEDPIAGWSASGTYLVDVVSAASADIVSTASQRWHEIRHAGSVNGNYKPGLFGVGANASISSEPDYLSWSVGANGQLEFNDKNESLLFGFSHAHDTIGVTNTPFDVFSHTLDRNGVDLGITFVVDRATILALVGDAVYERGDPSKPYRYIPMFAPGQSTLVGRGASVETVNLLRLPEKPIEQLPLTRDRYAVTGRIAHRYESSTLRLSERFYADSWGLKAATTDAMILFDVGEKSNFGPHFRFHSQLPAVFWQRAYELTFPSAGTWAFPALRTGDRELSPLTTISVGTRGRFDLGSMFDVGEWAFTTSVEGMWTHFFDTLYITDRLSLLVSIGLEVQL